MSCPGHRRLLPIVAPVRDDFYRDCRNATSASRWLFDRLRNDSRAALACPLCHRIACRSVEVRSGVAESAHGRDSRRAHGVAYLADGHRKGDGTGAGRLCPGCLRRVVRLLCDEVHDGAAADVSVRCAVGVVPRRGDDLRVRNAVLPVHRRKLELLRLPRGAAGSEDGVPAGPHDHAGSVLMHVRRADLRVRGRDRTADVALRRLSGEHARAGRGVW